MLFWHKLMDALNGDKTYKLNLPPHYELSDEFKKTVANTQKFDFGVLPLEPEKDNPGHWVTPNLSADEWEFWNEQLIPLPYQNCWFEFVLGGSRSALLVMEEANGWAVLRCDYCNDKVISFDGFVTNHAYHAKHIELAGDADWIQNAPSVVINSAACNVTLAIYMALMLNSRSTETKLEIPPVKLNKVRSKRGKTLLAPHRVITIVPRRFRETSDGQGGTHASPRLHWRRSHKRHFDRPVPSAKWVEKEVHKGRIGWYVAIIPRHLVGLAELGEISHEYFIPLDTRKPELITS